MTETEILANALLKQMKLPGWVWLKDGVPPADGDGFYAVYDRVRIVGGGLGIAAHRIPALMKRCELPIVLWRPKETHA